MTSDAQNMVMPVAPMYGAGYGNGGGDGFFGGNSGWWIILLLIVLGGGWNNGWGSNGNGGGMFPWVMAGQQTGYSDVQRGFDHSAVINGITGVQNAVTTGFGNVQTALCSGFAGVNSGIANGFAQAEIAANARQMADMNQNFAIQTGISDLKFAVATENCADRTQSMTNTRDIIENQTRGTQAILDKLCQLELDGVKGQLADANNTIGQLRTQLLVANNDASQTAQTAQILQGQAAEVDALYNRLNNCPVPSMPVYGRTPIFTCNSQPMYGCGCGCGAA